MWTGLKAMLRYGNVLPIEKDVVELILDYCYICGVEWLFDGQDDKEYDVTTLLESNALVDKYFSQQSKLLKAKYEHKAASNPVGFVSDSMKEENKLQGVYQIYPKNNLITFSFPDENRPYLGFESSISSDNSFIKLELYYTLIIYPPGEDGKYIGESTSDYQLVEEFSNHDKGKDHFITEEDFEEEDTGYYHDKSWKRSYFLKELSISTDDLDIFNPRIG